MTKHPKLLSAKLLNFRLSLASILFVVSTLPLIANSQVPPTQNTPSTPIYTPSAISDDYTRMFEYSLKLLLLPEVREFFMDIFKKELQISPELRSTMKMPEDFKVKEMSESQFIFLLQQNPSLWNYLDQYLEELPHLKIRKNANAKTREAYEAVKEKWRARFRLWIADQGVLGRFKVYNNPARTMPLLQADGKAGYFEPTVYFNHPLKYPDGRTTEAVNLKQVWIDFIRGAKQQLAINVFDFDLPEVAEEIIKKNSEFLKNKLPAVRVGIDASVIKDKTEVKKIYQLLKTAGVNIFKVNATGLNHHKIATRDWQLKSNGMVLLSSGNLTFSCIDPLGDYISGKVIAEDQKYLLPNANHIITMRSDSFSQLVNYQLTKILDLKLRGSENPLGGAFKVFGESLGGVKELPFMIAGFSPKGGLGDINRDIIAQVIAKTQGRIRMIQFAFSSKSIEDALFEHSRKEKVAGREYIFESVSHTAFSLEYWSRFLIMSGYDVVDTADGKHYVLNADSRWNKEFTTDEANNNRARMLVAPNNYGQHLVRLDDGSTFEVRSKIHHKIMICGEGENTTLIIGTSYNFTESANTNNEHILVIKDPRVVPQVLAAFENLRSQASSSVEVITRKRNVYLKSDGKMDMEERRATEELKRTIEKNKRKLVGSNILLSGFEFCSKQLKELLKSTTSHKKR
ncbi:MAG: phospholipase D-like domain-containing protein [Oligoflexia bacterium]|nr:phospholipase D-like domain-containing protein [Oligoflexia bacterium]